MWACGGRDGEREWCTVALKVVVRVRQLPTEWRRHGGAGWHRDGGSVRLACAGRWEVVVCVEIRGCRMALWLKDEDHLQRVKTYSERLQAWVGDGGHACMMEEEEIEMEMVGLQVKARRSSVGVGATVVWDLLWVPAVVEELGYAH